MLPPHVVGRVLLARVGGGALPRQANTVFGFSDLGRGEEPVQHLTVHEEPSHDLLLYDLREGETKQREGQEVLTPKGGGGVVAV